MALVELQNFLYDLVIDSPHLSRARGAPTSSDNRGGGRPAQKRPLENSEVVAT
jgi:hypothetical protein